MARAGDDTDDRYEDLPAPVSFLHERGKQGKYPADKPVHTQEHDRCHERVVGICQEHGTDDHCKNTPQEDKPPGKEADIRLLRSNSLFNQVNHLWLDVTCFHSIKIKRVYTAPDPRLPLENALVQVFRREY